jgi:hypothetical protein
MAWAAMAARKAPAAPAAPAVADLAGVSVLVVDANALINGVRLEGVAERVVTTAEVLDEIRDAKTRAFVASLPYEIHVMEPTEESCKAGESSMWAGKRGSGNRKGGAKSLLLSSLLSLSPSPRASPLSTLITNPNQQSSTSRAPRAKSPPSAPWTSA